MSTEAGKEDGTPTAADQPQEQPETAKEEQPSEEQQQETPKSNAEEATAAPSSQPADDGPPIVLVTGASGFIAMHIIRQLLEQGRLRVRGTVRDKTCEQKVKPLKELVPDAKYPLDLVDADLTKEDSWKNAVSGCSYVLHVASPLPRKSPKNPDAIVRPAVDGALNVLKACSESGTVKRVVLTSSIAAVAGGITGEQGKLYTEADWPTDEQCAGTYELSKSKAEKAAWEFIEKLEEGKKFELVTVQPGLVLGPFLSAASGEAAAGVLDKLLNDKMPAGVPNVSFPIIDVRDVAAAHIAAMENPGAAGNRYILYGKSMWYGEIAELVSREFKPQGYKIPTKPKKFLLNLFSKFDSGAKVAVKMQGKETQFSNDKMRGELGLEPHPVESAIIDASYSLIEIGVVKKKRGYLGHPDSRPKEPEKKEEPAAAAAEPKEETGDQQETKPDEAPAEEPKTEVETTKPEESKAEEPAAKEPSPEEPKAEPKAEEPVAEEAKAEEPPPEEPKPEEPAVEEPKEEESAAEEPKEEPAAEETAPEEPKAEPPPEEPVTEEPKAEEPATEEPKSSSEEPATEEPKAEEPATEEPKSEKSSSEEPATEEPKAEKSPSEESEEPKAEEPAKEEPRSEESTEEPEEPKAEEPAAEEPRSEESTEEPEESKVKESSSEEPEEPKAESPPEEAGTEEPKSEKSSSEEPATEEPKAEKSPSEESAKVEESSSEEPEEPKAEKSPSEEPEEPKVEDTPAEEAEPQTGESDP